MYALIPLFPYHLAGYEIFDFLRNLTVVRFEHLSNALLLISLIVGGVVMRGSDEH